MGQTAPPPESLREVYRRIAQREHLDWPVYSSTPLYDRKSTSGLESDCRNVADEWFRHDRHDSVEQFVGSLPVAYFRFEAHDRFDASAHYDMDTLFGVFVLKEFHGWEHESALVEYLEQSPALCEKLGLETVPDQSTLWRTWHQRFTADLREAIGTIGRTILLKAKDGGASVPREPERKLPSHDDEPAEPDFDDQEILNKAESITEHVSRVVFPAFSLNRGDSCEIQENAYWGLQTYLGLRENLAANEGARSFLYESDRDRTPLGHAHREHIRELSIDQIREMYRQAVNRLLAEVAETEQFFRAGIVAIDITEADPFTGDRAGHEEEIIGTKEKSDEYAYQ